MKQYRIKGKLVIDFSRFKVNAENPEEALAKLWKVDCIDIIKRCVVDEYITNDEIVEEEV